MGRSLKSRWNFFLGFALSLTATPTAIAAPTTWTVCAKCENQTIGDAVKKAQPGDLVQVKAGVYREDRILIDKPLHLQGLGSPVLDGEFVREILAVEAPRVVVEGFTFKNSGVGKIEDLAAVRIANSEGCVVQNNRFTNNYFALHLSNVKDCTLSQNVIHGEGKAEASYANGIHLWRSERITIKGNVISGHRDGIYLEFVTDSKVEDNDSHQNVRYGLHFMFSHRNEYRRNQFRNNGAGVAVMYSREILMDSNQFSQNWGTAAYGLLLKDIHQSTITSNVFEKNTSGIYMEGSNRSHFEGNQFLRNGWALKIMGNCDDNTFTANNFTHNTFDVITNSSLNPNRFTGNFWSNYDGYDLDIDGVGDLPFRPVNASSIIMERTDLSFLLLKSFFFSILDQVERAFPVLIPQHLTDDKPAMKPFPPKGPA